MRKEDRSLLIQYMGDTPKLRIIDFFLDNIGSDYSKKEIIEFTGISKTTFYKVWDELMQFEILTPTRRYGKAQLYTLNKDSTIIQKFKNLDDELARQIMEKSIKKEEPIAVTK